MMTQLPLSIAGLAAGAGGMFFLDPRRGRARRHLLRDKVAHSGHEAERIAEQTARDAAHRTRGAYHAFRSRLFPGEVPDDILVARVASRIGHCVSHPHPIGITADEGVIFISGPIYEDEVFTLLKTISRVPGVRAIRHELTPEARPEGVPRAGTRRGRISRKLLIGMGSMVGIMGVISLIRRDVF